jgi:hypothetical protein
MVRSPWSERKYYTGDVRLVPAKGGSDPNSGGANAVNAGIDRSPNMNANGASDRKTVTTTMNGASARAKAKQAASAGGGRSSLPPTTPRAPSPVPMRGFDGRFDHDASSSQFQPPARPMPVPQQQQQQQQQQKQQSPYPARQQREPPSSPAAQRISVIRDSWAQRDREATENSLRSSTFRVANVQQRSPSVPQGRKQQQQQQPQQPQPQQQRPAELNIPSIVTPGTIQSPARQPPSPMSTPSSSTASDSQLASLSQTLNVQAEQLATMERDYLNLISNLETEKKRVHAVLGHRTQERDAVRAEVDRLQRQLASKSNLTVQAEEESAEQNERISSLEDDLRRCAEALAQRDELIAERDTELAGMREAVCQAAEEKLYHQEQARVDSERRDKFQNGRFEKAREAVAEKDKLIREKEVEIDELKVSVQEKFGHFQLLIMLLHTASLLTFCSFLNNPSTLILL